MAGVSAFASKGCSMSVLHDSKPATMKTERLAGMLRLVGVAAMVTSMGAVTATTIQAAPVAKSSIQYRLNQETGTT